jgi:hypothetical protein
MDEIEELARFLFETMERLDPSEDFATDWCDLPEKDRELYRLCILAIIKGRRGTLVRLLSYDHVISRHPHKRE